MKLYDIFWHLLWSIVFKEDKLRLSGNLKLTILTIDKNVDFPVANESDLIKLDYWYILK